VRNIGGGELNNRPQGKSEVSLTDLAKACGINSVNAIRRHPDITSIKELDVADASADEPSARNLKSGAILLL
jgi:hypothetical protein